MVSHYFLPCAAHRGISSLRGPSPRPRWGPSPCQGILLLNSDYLLKLGLEPPIGGNQSSWDRHSGAIAILPTFFEEFIRQRPQLLGQCLFLGVLRLHGLAANMVNSLVGARFLEIAVSSGLSAGNSLPSAPRSINELTNKKQSKGNHNRNGNRKRIGCENRSVLRKKKILGMKI